MSQAIYQQVTDKIIAELEKGAAPWVQRWNGQSRSADKNLVTQKAYKGVNRLLLGMAKMGAGYKNPAWATYKQWQDAGFQVQKGEKGTQIVFYSPVAKPAKAETDDKGGTYHLLKSYTVFNAEQTNCTIAAPDAEEIAKFDPIPECERTLVKSGAIISHGGAAAFYSLSNDRIQLPEKADFFSREQYYATAFHELTHWSGHKSRCDRTLSGKFGNPVYAFEELIAEIGAAYLCADHCISGDLRHAGYIQSWLKACRDDNKAIFKAAAYAQKACDFINALEATAQDIAA